MSACHSFDGQCGDSWCNCDGYELAADKCKGNVDKIMKLMCCPYSTAKRVSDWWHTEQQYNKLGPRQLDEIGDDE